jgi:cell division GTPase FtsZ
MTSLIGPTNVPGLINVDLADVARVLRIPGQSTIAFGSGTHPERPALEAAKKALGNTVQPVDLARARGAIVSFIGGPNTRTSDCAEAIGLIASRLDPQAAIAYGIHADTCLADAVRVTLIVTGIEPPPPPPHDNWLRKLTRKRKA